MHLNQNLSSLDSRGYCTRVSIISNSSNLISYRLTLPPKSYPPTAPYNQLTSHFKKLVKDGKITRFLVKALLYPQILDDINTSNVILRRKHKNSLRAYRRISLKKKTSNASDDDDETECTSQSESESGSCASNPFGFVKYYNGPKSQNEIVTTEYESFIDHGPQATNERQLESGTIIKSSVSIDCDSDGSFCVKKSLPSIEIIKPRDSLPFSSKTIKLTDLDQPSRDTIIHTSTARLNIGQIKQYSDASAVSSFDNRVSGTNMACEDLVNMDDSVKIKNTLRQRTIVDERHSMPPLFVGNRFNSSSVTEVYIPSWKDKHDLQKSSISSPDEKHSCTSSPSTTTHSSSLDLPAIIPVSDELTAELLYNFDSISTAPLTKGRISESIINPPSMFDGMKSPPISQIKSHSFDNPKKPSNERSTRKKTKGDDDNTSNSDKSNKRPDSVRRCMSVQYVDLNQNKSMCESCRTSVASNTDKCKYCENLMYQSPRSSDSGMAGSCTLASPGPPKTDEFFYPFEEFNEKTESPSTSQNRTGRLRHSLSSHNIGRFSHFSLSSHNNNNDKDKDNTDSGQYGDNSLIRDEEYQSERKSKISNLSLSLLPSDNNDNTHVQLQRNKTNNRHSRCRSIERCTVNDVPPNLEEFDVNPDPSERIYRTGLYAHWWKKQKLPKEILDELYRLRRQNELSSIASSDFMVEGSGKPNNNFDGMSFLKLIY